MSEPELSAKFTAGLDLLGRTGAKSFEIRYSGAGDDGEQRPIVWIAVATYAGGWECAAGINPERAVMRLCAQLLDGGECVHCKRMSAFDDDADDTINEALSQGTVCWYMFDPELATFRMGCE